MSQELGNKSPQEAVARSNRVGVLAFLADAATEQIVRDGLSDIAVNGIDIRRGNLRTAIGAMTKLPTPEALIVDLSGEDQVLPALDELADVVEPGMRLLAIGETDDVDFYRLITHGHNVLEYVFKPVTREAIARHFLPLITNKAVRDETTRGGRVVAVTGTRGGVGATTIGINLAWYLGVVSRRHTIFVETDLHFGASALLLGGRPSPAFRQALELTSQDDPSEFSQLVQPISERLHLLAAEEAPGVPLNYEPGTPSRLIDALRLRYHFVLLDIAFGASGTSRELLNQAHHRVIVLDPTLASLRDCLRLLALPHGPRQPQTPTLVLNRSGYPGGLSQAQLEQALKTKIDIVIPDLPKSFTEQGDYSEPLMAKNSAYRRVIVELARDIGFVAARGDNVRAGGFRLRWNRRTQKTGSLHG